MEKGALKGMNKQNEYGECPVFDFPSMEMSAMRKRDFKMPYVDMDKMTKILRQQQPIRKLLWTELFMQQL